MAQLLAEGARLYKYVIYDLADEKMYHLPLVKSPVPMLTIITLYLLFVLKWGPEFMKHRNPFNLKKVLIIYNALQMICCIIPLIVGTNHVPFSEWKCTPVNHPLTKDPEGVLAGYTYFVLKIIDLLDTVFFVLKKNYRQITVLHVFHHTVMIPVCWIGMKYIPGGQTVYVPYVNTIVHVVMYGYYLLSAYDEKYKKSLWLKKRITQLQLLQFAVIIVLYTTPLIYDCGYPKTACLAILLLNSSMIVLFANFYYMTYIKKTKKL